jgi:hypothetical protein
VICKRYGLPSTDEIDPARNPSRQTIIASINLAGIAHLISR